MNGYVFMMWYFVMFRDNFTPLLFNPVVTARTAHLLTPFETLRFGFDV
jgi:hypothetical protein